MATRQRTAGDLAQPGRCRERSLGAQCLLPPGHGPEASGLVRHRFNHRDEATRDSDGENGPALVAPADGMYGHEDGASRSPRAPLSTTPTPNPYTGDVA